jgi:phage terminase large subunit-like protein
LDPQVVVDFLELLTLDNGKRWKVEPFQGDVIEELCAGVPETWLETPEGNAKSTLGAGIALAHALLVPRARVLLAAASRDQAGEATFGQALGLVMASEDVLGDTFKLQPGHRRILVPDMGSRIQVFSASKATGQGVIPTLVEIDEGHVLPDFGLVRVWRGKLRKRDGQMLLFSNAGEPGGIYESVKARAISRCRDVRRDGPHEIARGGQFTLHRWALEEGQNVEDLDLVKAANPLRSLTRDKLQAALESESFDRAHWSRMVCGVPVRGEQSAVSQQEWKRLRPGEIPAGEPIVAGLDLGWRHDTTAIGPVWVPALTRRVIGRPKILVPPRDGTSLPFTDIKDAFLGVHERNPIEIVAMDPSAGGRVVAEWLQDPDEGIGCRVVEVSPGNIAQAKVYDTWMESVREQWIEHPHDPELDAHVLNAIAKPISHDRYRFDRPTPSRAAKFQDQRVIDALIASSGALWVAIAELTAEPEPALNIADYRIERL